MKTENKLKLAGILLGTTLITATAAVAGATDGKCGTGSCGDKKAATGKVMEKAKDAKCGAGSCGDKNITKKVMDKDKKMKAASKSTDAKCGAGKCG